MSNAQFSWLSDLLLSEFGGAQVLEAVLCAHPLKGSNCWRCVAGMQANQIEMAHLFEGICSENLKISQLLGNLPKWPEARVYNPKFKLEGCPTSVWGAGALHVPAAGAVHGRARRPGRWRPLASGPGADPALQPRDRGGHPGVSRVLSPGFWV